MKFDKSWKSESNDRENFPCNFEDLCSDDYEMYSFQCPESFDPQIIANKTLYNGKMCKTEGTKTSETYSFEVFKVDNECISVAFPTKAKNTSLLRCPLNGHIIIQKILSESSENWKKPPGDNDGYPQFPKDIKIRHPLLGSNWKIAISRAERASLKTSQIHKSKKKKSRKSDSESSKRKR